MKRQTVKDTAPAKIAAAPAAEKRVCRVCGRELPIDEFAVRSKGRKRTYCRQCATMARAHGSGGAEFVRETAREHMQTITATVDALYNEEDRPEYAIDDVLEEIRLGAGRFTKLIRNTCEHHPALMGDPKNSGRIDSLIEVIAADISNMRRS